MPRSRGPMMPVIRRSIARVLIALQVLLGVPSIAAAESSRPPAATPQDPPPVRVNRTRPTVTAPPARPVFSTVPTDAEILRARVFPEPLVPIGASSPQENVALAVALNAYLDAQDGERLRPIQGFMESHATGVWQPSLVLNAGLILLRDGYFARAGASFRAAWNLAKSDSGVRGVGIADRAMGELLALESSLGHADVVEQLIQEVGTRPLTGAATERLSNAKQALFVMRTAPDEAFRCGPYALVQMLRAIRPPADGDAKLLMTRAGPQGMSLARLAELGRAAGVDVVPIKHTSGTSFAVPGVVHFKAGHFAAVLAYENDRYLVRDATANGDRWVTAAALQEESSGAMLGLQAGAPTGWEPMNADAAATVWGRGFAIGPPPNGPGPDGPRPPRPPCKGMAAYSVHLMEVSLDVYDAPIGYTPPFGPAVSFTATYNQRESHQPTTFTYANLGPQWTFDWMSYVTDDPTNASASVGVFRRGGSEDTYTGFNSTTGRFAIDSRERTLLTRTSASHVRYERLLPDGSIEVFAQPDGASTYPRRVFMTQSIDPQGNALTFTYDAQLRVVAVTDAVGQVTTLDYELAQDIWKVTKVTDPFGRTARFAYDDVGRLVRITDVIGITSAFTYAADGFITSLTTPYGTSRFVKWDSGYDRSIEMTDAAGGKQRVEYHATMSPWPAASDPAATVPTVSGVTFSNGFLEYRNTLYWDQKAMAAGAGDPTKAHLYHWLHVKDNVNQTVSILESEKAPLENRVWYRYPNQAGAVWEGDGRQPTVLARVLDDGTTQAVQFEYDSLTGQITRATDPVGRTTLFTYATNGIDPVDVRQLNGQNTELLESFTTNAQHLPLTITDASGQTATYTYNARGQLLTTTTPGRAGITETRTATYGYDSNGNLSSLTGPDTGATSQYTYDGYGRVRTVTDSDNYVMTYDYDALDRVTKITYPDGTYEQTIYKRLDAELKRDRLGRWTHISYDAVRRPAAIRDSLGQTINQQWCSCGSLEKLIDPNGNTTTWERDVQGRVIRTIRPDGSDATITYENTTSRPKQLRDAKLQVVAIQYFADDNWKQVSYSNTTQPTPTVGFTYDSIYNRMATMTDGAGTTTYTYNPVTATPAMGAARLASVDGPLANDTISYTYDELGRVVQRSINGVALSRSYDALGRLTGETNALGAFSYAYDGVTDRLLSMTYPNGQSMTLGYLGTSQGHRLQDIHNKLSSGATLSRFQYTYSADGAIATWSQQVDGNAALLYELAHDSVNQLTGAALRTTGATPSVLKRYMYVYDKIANRTGEQIDDASMSASMNTLNAMTSLQPGGALRVAGTLDEAAVVTVQGKPADVTASNEFSGSVPVPSGTSNVTIVAMDPSGNTRTNTYEVSESGVTRTLTYDANGSLTSDGQRTFEWDGANRLTAVSQASHRSEFTYDGWGHRTRIVEKESGVVTTDRRFLWCGMAICEERDSGGANVTRRFFDQGVQESGSSFFYTTDHLGSVRELTDATGAVRARYDYDPYGRVTKVSGDKDSAFTFTGHFAHGPSGLLLAPLRAYDPDLGRWINQDPIGPLGGLNPYAYVGGAPTDMADPLGLLAPGLLGSVGAGMAAAAAQGGFWGTPVGPLGIAAGVVGGAIVGGAAGYWWWRTHPSPPADPHSSTAGASGNGSGGPSASGNATTTTPSAQDENERKQEREAYKKRCNESPPKCLNPCETARWTLQRNIDCRRMRQTWDDKWYPGRHDGDIANLDRGIKDLRKWIWRNCK
jgi:RHS repeat-associated protein